ncbi:MAG: SgcJ/EcaC family oxidoreductase [Verrucomicrobia bacterium]|nr:SgcJ/EcaC family oxidoreductase [Verrucomicrobiota bacterium]
MKRRLLLTLTGLAIGFAVPTFAQQKEPVDPQLIQTLHDTIISKKYNEAINNHDAAAIAALFTEDAIFVTDTTGPLYGRQAIEKFYTDTFKGWQPKNHTSTTDPHSARMLGPDTLTRAGVWSETGKGKNGEDVAIKGYWSEIDTRQGDTWKLCQLTACLTPDSWALIYKSFGLPPATAPSPTASPSGP